MRPARIHTADAPARTERPRNRKNGVLSEKSARKPIQIFSSIEKTMWLFGIS